MHYSDAGSLAKLHQILRQQGPTAALEYGLLCLKSKPERSELQAEVLWLLSESPPSVKLSCPQQDQALLLLRTALPQHQSDLQPWVNVCLHLLLARAEVRAVLSPPKLLPEIPPTLFLDNLLLTLLQQTCLSHPEMELCLRDWRALLLQSEPWPVAWLPFGFALAHQLWNTGYIYALLPTEKALLARLKQELCAVFSEPRILSELSKSQILRYALYGDLSDLKWPKQLWVALMEQSADLPWLPLLQKLLFDRDQEIQLAAEVPCLTSLPSDDCQTFYERYPYPRWLAAPDPPESSRLETLELLFPTYNWRPHFSEQPTLMIAGCGTGKQVLAAAQACPQAQLMAFDVSRASLAYAARMLKRYALTQAIPLYQADLMALSQIAAWQQAFDLLECGGVLHHLLNPLAGLQQLLQILKPGGLLRLGVYSHQARRALKLPPLPEAARHHDDALRTWRWQWLHQHPTAPLNQILDFYQLNHCRDLLAHPREQALELQVLAQWCHDLQLEVLGLELWDPRAYALYARHYPDEPAQCQLTRWAALEQDYPGLFAQMYILWLKKEGAQK